MYIIFYMKKNNNILIWGGGLRCQNIIQNSKYILDKKLTIKYIIDTSLKKLDFKTDIVFSNKLNEINKIIKDCSYFIVAVGSEHGKARFFISTELMKFNLKPLSYISGHSIINPSATIGMGLQAHDGSIIQGYSKIGDYCIINTNAIIDHHSYVGNGCHIMPSATITGNVIIKDFVTIGSNATILPNIRIESGAIIGAGSVVTKNVKKNELIAGNPAKKIKLVTHKFDLSYFKKN